MITTRTARAEDEAVLAKIDERTWTPAVSPAPAPPAGTPFFDGGTRPEDVLVAEQDGAVAGYVRLGEGFGIPAHRHVLVVDGLAVDPDRQRLGIAPPRRGRRVYERCGFVTEGVLRGEFRIDGEDVDDVLMARSLA
ncbi:GNAT family N-acetyltransferase [Amycolatopsis sp. NPDC026612]|uniref:GNAT family N-acetyltransferase n=1 Tax=Amycolatopsis sp. NPDC026612 TaxID=3155466 RepID=UPI0033E38B42